MKIATKELADTEFDIRLGKILTSIPAHWKDWIKRKLTNFSTLKERLNDIIRDYEYILKEYIDVDKFINRTVKTRNYLTHYSTELNKIILTDYEIDIYAEKLKLILTLCILSEIGFSKEEIGQIISRHQHYNNLKNYNID